MGQARLTESNSPWETEDRTLAEKTQRMLREHYSRLSERQRREHEERLWAVFIGGPLYLTNFIPIVGDLWDVKDLVSALFEKRNDEAMTLGFLLVVGMITGPGDEVLGPLLKAARKAKIPEEEIVKALKHANPVEELTKRFNLPVPRWLRTGGISPAVRSAGELEQLLPEIAQLAARRKQALQQGGGAGTPQAADFIKKLAEQMVHLPDGHKNVLAFRHAGGELHAVAVLLNRGGRTTLDVLSDGKGILPLGDMIAELRRRGITTFYYKPASPKLDDAYSRLARRAGLHMEPAGGGQYLVRLPP